MLIDEWLDVNERDLKIKHCYTIILKAYGEVEKRTSVCS